MRPCLAFALIAVLAVAPAFATDPPATEEAAEPDDGWLDLSEFLDRPYGFVPLVVPITEPAIGYGAGAGLVFLDRHGAPGSAQYQRPDLMGVGGLWTENGTDGVFGGYSGRWRDGRLQATAGLADAEIHLDLYPTSETGVGYTAETWGGLAEGKHRLAASPFWTGLRYVYAEVDVSFDDLASRPPELQSDEQLTLSGLGAILTYDGRDNLFTPSAGQFFDVTWTVFDDALGSDRDFQRADFLGLTHHQLGAEVFLGIKGGARWSSDDTPFYLRPFIELRGVQALRYQGSETGEVEAELRWQFHRRFSAVAFGGAGVAAGRELADDESETATAGGAGFRYLVARSYGLHMGLDVARGPEQTIYYVVFGNAWFRP